MKGGSIAVGSHVGGERSRNRVGRDVVFVRVLMWVREQVIEARCLRSRHARLPSRPGNVNMISKSIRVPFSLLDSLYNLKDILLFIDKLLIVLVVVEVAQVENKSVSIPSKDILNDDWLFGIGDKDLQGWQMSGQNSVIDLVSLSPLTLNTWNASNWIFLLLSLSRFIISLRLSSLEIYRVMTLKLVRSSRISPSSLSDCRLVT